MAPASPWAAYLLGSAVEVISEQLPAHRWDYGWRLDDVTRWLDDPRNPIAWGGRSQS